VRKSGDCKSKRERKETGSLYDGFQGEYGVAGDAVLKGVNSRRTRDSLEVLEERKKGGDRGGMGYIKMRRSSEGGGVRKELR